MLNSPLSANPVDFTAISMLAFACIALAIIATLILRVFKNHNAKPSPEDQLIESLDNKKKPQQRPKGKKSPTKNQPWEKDADWWKQ